MGQITGIENKNRTRTRKLLSQKCGIMDNKAKAWKNEAIKNKLRNIFNFFMQYELFLFQFFILTIVFISVFILIWLLFLFIIIKIYLLSQLLFFTNFATFFQQIQEIISFSGHLMKMQNEPTECQFVQQQQEFVSLCTNNSPHPLTHRKMLILNNMINKIKDNDTTDMIVVKSFMEKLLESNQPTLLYIQEKTIMPKKTVKKHLQQFLQKNRIPEHIMLITIKSIKTNISSLRKYIQQDSPSNIKCLYIGKTFTCRKKQQRIEYTVDEKNTMLKILQEQFNKIRVNTYVDVDIVDYEISNFSNDYRSGYLQLIWFKLSQILSQLINIFQNSTNKFNNQLSEKLQLTIKIRNDDNKESKQTKNSYIYSNITEQQTYNTQLQEITLWNFKQKLQNNTLKRSFAFLNMLSKQQQMLFLKKIQTNYIGCSNIQLIEEDISKIYISVIRARVDLKKISQGTRIQNGIIFRVSYQSLLDNHFEFVQKDATTPTVSQAYLQIGL